jgi:parallel beta-helix repeat protein
VRCRNGVQSGSCRDVVVHAVRRSTTGATGSCSGTRTRLARQQLGRQEQRRRRNRSQEVPWLGHRRRRRSRATDARSQQRLHDHRQLCEDNYAGGITLGPTVADDPKTREDESALIWEQRARVSGNLCRGRQDGKRRGGEHPHGAHGIHVRNSSDVVVTDNLRHHNNSSGIAVVNSLHVLVQSNACFQNTNGIGIFNRPDLKDLGRHLIGVNMTYDDDDDDLKGMQ